MGRDKALLVHDGIRMIDRVHARLSQVADPVLFAPGEIGRLGPLPGPEVADAVPGAGPLGAIAAGLAASPHELIAVAAVDMPWASGAVFGLLAELWSGEEAVVPVDVDGPQVLHALYARRSLAAFTEALDRSARGLRALLDDLDVRYVTPERWAAADPSGRFAANINRPEDLALLAEPG